jgi:hypothetical protein
MEKTAMIWKRAWERYGKRSEKKTASAVGKRKQRQTVEK